MKIFREFGRGARRFPIRRFSASVQLAKRFPEIFSAAKAISGGDNKVFLVSHFVFGSKVHVDVEFCMNV